MDYIREFCPKERTCLVRTNSQGKSAAHLRRLLRMAKSDFPTLDENFVMLVRVKNDHRAQSYAWAFAPIGTVPEKYTVIEAIPYLVDPVPPI